MNKMQRLPSIQLRKKKKMLRTESLSSALNFELPIAEVSVQQEIRRFYLSNILLSQGKELGTLSSHTRHMLRVLSSLGKCAELRLSAAFAEI